MPRMSYQNQAFHTCTDAEVPSMVAQGWHVCTDAMWNELILKKKGVAKTEHVATIQEQPATRRPGRPRKEQIPSILNDGAIDGNGPNTD